MNKKWISSILFTLIFLLIFTGNANAILFKSKIDLGTGTIVVTRFKSAYDGDTFRAYLPGFKKDMPIRVKGVDTPEIKGQCGFEKRAAIKSRDFVRRYLKSANEIILTDVGRDRYQRILANVIVDGKNLAKTLISKGLGRKWRGKREQWCD